MSKRGATHKGPYRRKSKRPPGKQRNRKMDKVPDGLYTMPTERFEAIVKSCKGKVPHATYGAAYAAKVASEGEYGCEFSIYECPICGKWHLTTHPRRVS